MPHDQRVPPALAHRHHMRCLAERLQPLPLGGQVRRDLQLAQKRVDTAAAAATATAATAPPD
jgi:hypothetical protein